MLSASSLLRSKPPLYNSPGSSTQALESSPRWRSMLDNCMVEFVASLFVILALMFSWGWKANDDPFMQFIPALSIGLTLLCLKDEDYFFPDGSWTVTIVLWALGGYGSWTHVLARLVGQTLAFVAALAICTSATLPVMLLHADHPLPIVFVLEMFATMLEHMAVVYVVMPLLPADNTHGANFLFPKVKPKSDQSTKAPSNVVVMHAAVTFSALHWSMWRAFGTEMNPAITIVMAYVRDHQLHDPTLTAPHMVQNPWDHATMAVWGQLVGLLLSLAYTAAYIPRESKLWR